MVVSFLPLPLCIRDGKIEARPHHTHPQPSTTSHHSSRDFMSEEGFCKARVPRSNKGKKLKILKKASIVRPEVVEGGQPGSKDFNHGIIGPDRSPETLMPLSFGYQTIEMVAPKELKLPYQSHGGMTRCQPQEELVCQEDIPQGYDNLSDSLPGDGNSDDGRLTMGRTIPWPGPLGEVYLVVL